MADPTGFWDSTTAGKKEFTQNLMRATLLQHDTRANLDALTDYLGMMGFSTDEHTLLRNNGSTMVPLELVETGADAAKPAGAAANNGRIFFATDTKILYIVENGTQYKIGTTEHDELTAGSVTLFDHGNPDVAPVSGGADSTTIDTFAALGSLTATAPNTGTYDVHMMCALGKDSTGAVEIEIRSDSVQKHLLSVTFGASYNSFLINTLVPIHIIQRITGVSASDVIDVRWRLVVASGDAVVRNSWMTVTQVA